MVDGVSLVQIFSAVGSVVTGVAAIGISLLVWQLNHQRLRVERERFKQELFERRFSVYQEIEKFLDYVISDSFRPEYYQTCRLDFMACWPNIHFYFKNDVMKFYYKCLRAADALAKSRGASKSITPELKSTKQYDQTIRLSEGLIDVFKPYLKLDERFM